MRCRRRPSATTWRTTRRRTGGVWTASTNRPPAPRTTPATRPSRLIPASIIDGVRLPPSRKASADRLLSYSSERFDSRHECPREPRRFVPGGAACEQAGPECRFCNPPRFPIKPLDVLHRDASSDFGALPLVAEVHDLVVDGRHETRRLRFEAGNIPAVPRADSRPPFAHGAAPVGNQVARLRCKSRNGILEDRGIGAA